MEGKQSQQVSLKWGQNAGLPSSTFSTCNPLAQQHDFTSGNKEILSCIRPCNAVLQLGFAKALTTADKSQTGAMLSRADKSCLTGEQQQEQRCRGPEGQVSGSCDFTPLPGSLGRCTVAEVTTAVASPRGGVSA